MKNVYIVHTYTSNPKNKKDNKGITLIALIVTIIVLLILAGVIIATLTGENGLLNKAKTAAEQTKKAEAIEDIKLKIIEIQAEKHGNATLEDLAQYLKDSQKDEYMITTESSKTSRLTEGSIEVSEIGNAEKIYITNIKYGYEIEVNKDLTINEMVVSNNVKTEKDTGLEIADGDQVLDNESNEEVWNGASILMTTVSDITSGSFKINVNTNQALNAETLYYYVNDKLVYSGTNTSYTVTEIDGKSIEKGEEYSIKVIANPYSLKVVADDGDNVDSWLACIGYSNKEGYTVNNLDLLFANEQLMNNLLNSDTAIEYLFNSESKILPALLNSSQANKYKTEIANQTTITSNMVYSATWTSNTPKSAFDGVYASSWNDSYIWLANNSVQDCYIGYKFNEPVAIYKLSVHFGAYNNVSSQYSFRLEGLKEDGTWEDTKNAYTTDFTSAGSFKWGNYDIKSEKLYYGYRIRNNYSQNTNTRQYWHLTSNYGFGISELQFYCLKGTN